MFTPCLYYEENFTNCRCNKWVYVHIICSVAIAIIKISCILLLDGETSTLGYQFEWNVQEALDNIMSN